MHKEVMRPPSVATEEILAPLFLIRQLALTFDPTNPAEIREYKQKIVLLSERSAERVKEIDRLLSVASGEVDLKPVSIREVCRACFARAEKDLALSGTSLELRFSNRRRLVVGNPDLIFAIIYSFCLNSTNYASAEGKIWAKVADHGEGVRIEIRDFGPLLSKKAERALFERNFSRGIKKNALRPDLSSFESALSASFARAMGGQVGALRHSDGMSFYLDLKASRQGRLF